MTKKAFTTVFLPVRPTLDAAVASYILSTELAATVCKMVVVPIGSPPFDLTDGQASFQIVSSNRRGDSMKFVHPKEGGSGTMTENVLELLDKESRAKYARVTKLVTEAARKQRGGESLATIAALYDAMTVYGSPGEDTYEVITRFWSILGSFVQGEVRRMKAEKDLISKVVDRRETVKYKGANIRIARISKQINNRELGAILSKFDMVVYQVRNVAHALNSYNKAPVKVSMKDIASKKPNSGWFVNDHDTMIKTEGTKTSVSELFDHVILSLGGTVKRKERQAPEPKVIAVEEITLSLEPTDDVSFKASSVVVEGELVVKGDVTVTAPTIDLQPTEA
jgi:hypothetical protein